MQTLIKHIEYEKKRRSWGSSNIFISIILRALTRNLITKLTIYSSMYGYITSPVAFQSEFVGGIGYL
jgi:hypothetical protein